ncbi:CLUMA_CG011607, isoform A [Clunio marinus]|uniref:CLUMA_CG011607, isoform A n=1 Tax=Clunio marinus TaxID=568069 RepID=A0A1J1ID99_9DIPT|nr:CLUMA_CG011607, isoform A [Clunio marinus]
MERCDNESQLYLKAKSKEVKVKPRVEKREKNENRREFLTALIWFEKVKMSMERNNALLVGDTPNDLSFEVK